MSHDPRHDDVASPPARTEPTSAAAQPSQPMGPEVVRAGWRYSARSKNQGLAWGLWAGSALLIGPFALAFVVYIATFALAMNADLEGQDPVRLMMPIFSAWTLLILAGLAAYIWWLVDSATMHKSLEAADEEIRRKIAAEHGADPWAF